jgi:predicted protein tyrosine phosphatase
MYRSYRRLATGKWLEVPARMGGGKKALEEGAGLGERGRAMFIEEINQHLQIGSQEEAIRLVRADAGLWSVVSIHGSYEERAKLGRTKRVHYARFDDTEDEEPTEFGRPARADDLARVFRFVESVGNDPLLVHCQVGISRSTAVALAALCRRLAGRAGFADLAVDLLLKVRPIARPNVLVLRLGLEQFLPAPQAATLAVALVNHPRLRANRYQAM